MLGIEKVLAKLPKSKMNTQIIFIGSDHAGFHLKEKIVDFYREKHLVIANLGTHEEDPADYPDYAIVVANAVVEEQRRRLNTKGILVCATGSGMAVTANKVKGIRAVNCFNAEMAEMARKHNDANIICLGAKYVSVEDAINMVEIFLNSEFEGGRHKERVDKIHTLTGN